MGLRVKIKIGRAGARASLVGLAALLGLLALAPAALAGSPGHPREEALDITGLNHACAAAVDSHGDVYLSSAGEAKVKVYDSGHSLLTSIPDAHEPCAIAVDSQGNLYVSEAETGEVVRYHPSAYPPTALMTYSATTVDSSGNARGIAVDQSDDSLYVAEGASVAVYKSDGTLMTADEVQVLSFSGTPSGGTYKLSFEGSETAALPFEATAAELQAALEALPTVGAGNVEVIGNSNKQFTFVGDLAAKDVSQIGVDGSAILGGGAATRTARNGFDGHLGDGELTDATGVAAFTSHTAESFTQRRYISVADAGADEIKVFVGRLQGGPFQPGTLEARTTIDGSQTPEGELGLAPTGAYLGVDPKSGHLLSYDAAHSLVDEFEATGRYFTRIADPQLEDAEPTAIAVDRSGGAGEGTLYVTAGAGTGAEALAFGPTVTPSRATLGEPPGHSFTGICGTAVDSHGDVYAAGETAIKVYGPSGAELTSLTDLKHPCSLAVDSEGNLYAANRGEGEHFANTGNESVVRYAPSSYPPTAATTYAEAATIETIDEPRAVAVDPVTGHLFVGHSLSPTLREYASATEGSGLLASGFCGFSSGEVSGVDVYGATGDVYVLSPNAITVCNASGTKQLAVIDGSGSPQGQFATTIFIAVAVDQSNGHVLVGLMKERGQVEEYEPSGTFIAVHGTFTKGISSPSGLSGLALDPTSGGLYVAYNKGLSAFGPLDYGEAPAATTTGAAEVGGGEATLNGTLDPNAFALTSCRFQYLADSQYLANGETFAGAASLPCEESLAAIGEGDQPAPVHARLGGLDPGGRYRFRLVAENRFGAADGEPLLFGPPLASTEPAQPIFYNEATLRGEVDPSGIGTGYRFEYGLREGEYETSTETRSLPASAGPTQVEAPVIGLAEGTTYHFRLVAVSEAGEAHGQDEALTTQERHPALSCPNQTLRLENNSSRLPDCRAYELVTPPDTRGLTPNAGEVALFNDWLVTPTGPGAGDTLTFHLEGTLPGTEGNGEQDYFRATRDEGGWGSALFGPTFAEIEEIAATLEKGIASDQLYSFWFSKVGNQDENYLRTPEGLEVLGRGSLGNDLGATPAFISAGGAHVIFASETNSSQEAVKLEPGAPEPPIGAIYDRSPGGPTHLVSVAPTGEEGFFETHEPTYEGATPDGASVVFAVGGNLYLRRNNETVEVTEGPASFAGVSADGKRVFYTDSTDTRSPAGLFAFDVEGEESTRIATNAMFAVVSADGSRAYFVKEGQLEVWAGGEAREVAALDPKDLTMTSGLKFPNTGNEHVALDAWEFGCVIPFGSLGRNVCPLRTTPDGNVLVFQTHADLTPPYEGGGHSEIYRYDTADESLLCLSCEPSGAVGSADADLVSFNSRAPINATTLVPNVTDDGNEVVFQTTAALLPEDANSVLDVYEWQAQGTGGCGRAGGCLALISSGQGDSPSFVYSMTPDGHDVFFSTQEKLIGSDIAGSPSIYDARVDGGFPQGGEAEPCHGDACQGEATEPPRGSTVRSDAPGAGNVEEKSKPPRCPKGRHRIRRHGKLRCVKGHHGHAKKRHRNPGAKR
jgi:hypothetical protein